VKKLLLVVLQIGLGFVFATSTQMKLYEGKDRLLGPVHIIRTEVAEIHKHNNQYTEGSRTLTHTAVYDAKMRLTEESRSALDGSITTKTVFSYSTNGQIAEAKQYNNGHFTGKTIYTYDDRGDLIEEAYQAVDGTLLFQLVYAHNPKRNQTKVFMVNASGSRSLRLVLTYDTKGRVTETALCSSGSTQSGSVITETEEGERVIVSVDSAKALKLSACGDELLVSRTVTTYNDRNNGSTKEISEHNSGLLTGKKVSVLHTQARVAEIAEYNSDGTLRNKEFYTYEIDVYENWVKRIKSKWNAKTNKSKPIEVTYRIIEYY